MKNQENNKIAIAKYSEVIEEIHNEFDSAQETLVAHANKIINGETEATDKATRLKNIGFDKAKEVIKTEHTVKMKMLAEQTAKIVDYYSRKYPLYKYITEDKVMIIAEKYNLFLGEVRDYTGEFIPEKNLREMENFKVDPNDVPLEGTFTRKPATLKIVAPIKDFDMQGKIVVGRKIMIPDPIVLQPVKYGGFLVITKWGDEASDPILTNPIEN